MAELKKFGPEHVMPMHRSGRNFIDLAEREIPELVRCGTGGSFIFSAQGGHHVRFWREADTPY